MLQNIEEEYDKLLKVKAIKIDSRVLSHLKWQKAVNDLLLSKGLLKISTSDKIKDSLDYPEDATFFDWVIVSSYYSIFHSAQALLGMKGIKIQDRVHHATLISFAKHFIINKELEDELYLIYEDVENKAKNLLEIFEEEKKKRGMFQYHRLSRNNLHPAEESVQHANTFLDAVSKLLVKKKVI